MANELCRETGTTTGASGTVVDRRVLLHELEAAHRLYSEGDLEGARSAFMKVRVNARLAGIRSANVEWGLAVTLTASPSSRARSFTSRRRLLSIPSISRS